MENRSLSNENNSISTFDNSKSEAKSNKIEFLEEDPDPSQICHRIIFKVKTILLKL